MNTTEQPEVLRELGSEAFANAVALCKGLPAHPGMAKGC